MVRNYMALYAAMCTLPQIQVPQRVAYRLSHTVALDANEHDHRPIQFLKMANYSLISQTL